MQKQFTTTPYLVVSILLGLCCDAAMAQVTPEERSLLRPMVLMQWPVQDTGGGDSISATEAARVAVGIFDTGDPLNTFSPETAELIDPGFLAAAGGGRQGGLPLTNAQFAVAKATTFNSSGFLGAVLAGPEINTPPRGAPPLPQPAHIFTTATNVNQTDPLNRGQYNLVTEYYNSSVSENHIGMPFVSQPSAGGARLAAQIDPINARVMPFPYDSRPTDIAGLAAGVPILPLDEQTSSVSFFAHDDVRVPTFPKNSNPGNVFQIAFTPRNFNGGAAVANFNTTEPNTGLTDTTNGASIAPRPFVTIDGADYLMDTGAPVTVVSDATWLTLPDTGGAFRIMPEMNIPLVGGGDLTLTDVPVAPTTGTPVLGANVYNMFGQFWDFERNQLTLTGPIVPDVFFSTDRATVGLQRSGVSQESRFGSNGVPPEQGSDVFRTGMTGSNALFVAETALGLVPGGAAGVDNVNALSYGLDGLAGLSFQHLSFSVEANAAGQDFTDLASQNGALKDQDASDIFDSDTGSNAPGRAAGGNVLMYNQELLGLGVAGGANGRGNVGPDFNIDGDQDELDGLELHRPRVIDVLDDPISDYGQLMAEEYFVYFSLDLASPSLGGPNSADDIFINGHGGPALFADGIADIGLLADDDLDALTLDDISVGLPGLGILNTGRDKIVDDIFSLEGIDPLGSCDIALFSLAPDSPSLEGPDGILGTADDFSPGDVFITDFDGTYHMFATAESLGLLFADNLDALDTDYALFIPEPAALSLLILGAAAAFRRRRRS